MSSMRLTVTFLASVLSSRVASQISTSADLNCGFEAVCRWRNATAGEDSGDFLTARSVRMENHFNIVPSKNGTEEAFAYTHGPFGGPQKATLISDTISCQLGGGTLTFWYYRTSDLATLEVCVRQPPGSTDAADLRCFPVFSRNHARQWLLNAIEFPPITQPFEFLIRANYVQPFDIIALDDVNYDAALCENVNSRLAEGAGGKFTLFDDPKNLFGNSVDGADLLDKSLIALSTSPKRLLPLYASPTSRRSGAKWLRGRSGAQWVQRCPFTDCSFDSANMCHYVSVEQIQDDEDLLLDLPSNSVLKKWELSKHRVANSLTGIMGDLSGGGWFAYAGGTNNPATIFLMQTSQALYIPEDSRVDFYVHMAGKYGRLRVCMDSLQKCPFERTGQQLSSKTRTWTNFRINISRGFHTIYFVADNLKKNYVIGLDNIQLLDKYGATSASCTGMRQ